MGFAEEHVDVGGGTRESQNAREVSTDDCRQGKRCETDATTVETGVGVMGVQPVSRSLTRSFRASEGLKGTMSRETLPGPLPPLAWARGPQ